ncbi:His-Xaa-Ser system-associated MauG-like protein [Sinorhizobium meliloti]|uniref:His-Xaa-Ser system-associated MauG-like protein n=1 Tax=Rhizobium meliloti TaxID=382 RepID=UPI001AED0DD7|nr:His-Xaa-Ser system-associated MauG-like protein [Sinorhizobium meliloti]
MKSATKFGCFAIAILLASQAGVTLADGLREQVLRDAAKRAGLIPAEATHVTVDQKLAAAGKLLFQSKKMSLDHETACATCHVDRFGSADGIPNAIGTEGHGEGVERLLAGGDIIPRNTLPFWGRGGVGFDVFFWDGKVDKSSGTVVSQFGDLNPSADPLVVAAHLPPVEIGEMVTDSKDNEPLRTENVSTAAAVYHHLLDRLLQDDGINSALVAATGKSANEIEFLDVASAIAAFIRDNFKLQSTRFHDFVFADGKMSEQEIAGGLIFYGKARCSTCHSGAYFSDMEFHAVPFPQSGFGKNGFGVDYGRFNVTLNPDDRYRFRTPPLFNVSRTAPYSHSGSIMKLADAIRVHVDPFAVYDPSRMSAVQRAEYYQALKVWSDEPLVGVTLDDAEIDALTAFLRTLEFDSASPVQVSD